MTEKTKKILIISLFIGSVLGIAVALYFMFLYSPTIPEPTVIDKEDITAGILPEAEEGLEIPEEVAEIIEGLREASEVARGGVTEVVALTTAPVTNVEISTSGEGINFYDENDGRFYTITEDGDVKRLSDTQFKDAESVDWNKDSDKAVIEFPDGSNVIYDFNLEKQVTLPKHWEDFKFSPTKDSLIAKSIGLDPRNRSLVVFNDTGSNVRAVQELGYNADKVTVSPAPHDQVIAFSDTGETSTFNSNFIIPIGQNGENFKGLVVEGFEFDPIWSPSGDKLLYSAVGEASNYQPLLWVVSGTTNALGNGRKSLGLNTWIDKCTFENNTTAYCAVPKSLPSNGGLQRSRSINNPDNVYRVNLTTGISSLIAVPENDAAMTNLRVSSDGSNLFYINSKTGILEKLRLK